VLPDFKALVQLVEEDFGVESADAVIKNHDMIGVVPSNLVDLIRFHSVKFVLFTLQELYKQFLI